MRTDTANFSAINQGASKRPFFVVELAFDFASTDLVYFTSHAEAATPAGAHVLASTVRKISGTTQKIDPDKGNSTIGAINVQLVDVNGAISALLHTKDAEGQGLRRRRLRVYQGFEGLGWDDYVLVQTQIVDGIKQKGGGYQIACADIQRAAREEVFTLRQTNLARSISASDTLIPVYSVEGFETVAHGPSYTDAPNRAVGYIKIDDEIIRWTETTTDPELGLCFVADQRGALNTLAVAHEVDQDAEQDRRTEVTEYVYLELPAVKLAYAILTGSLYNQPGERLPASWHLGIPGEYIRTADFTGIGEDWWNPDDDTQGIIVRFAGLEKEDGKKFLETEVMLLLAAFMPVYSDGQLGLRRMTSVLSGAAHIAELTASNVVSHGELRHDLKGVHNVLSINWNWDDQREEFTRQKILVDQTSIDKHGEAPALDLEFRGLHGSRHGDSVITSTFDRLRDRYAGPPQRLSVRVLPSLNTLEVGDIVRLRLDTLRDHIAGATVDRAFEVQQVKVDWQTGQVQLELFGSSQAADFISPGEGQGASLPDDWYSATGQNLANYLGAHYSRVGGVGHITGGSLVGGSSIHTSVFYHDGDLEIDSAATLYISGNVQLRVRGHLQINGRIDGEGAGLSGAPAPPGQWQTADGSQFGRFNPGTPGYLGATESGGGILSNNGFQSAQGHRTNGRHAALNVLTLTIAGDRIDGLPSDLRGTSGASGHASTLQFRDGTRFNAMGGAGGSSGAGLMVICRGASFGEAGVINVSGGPGSLGQYVGAGFGDSSLGPNRGRPYLWAGSGAGGGPGAVLFLLDGNTTAIPELRNVVARNGETPIPPPLTVDGRGPFATTVLAQPYMDRPPAQTLYSYFTSGPRDMSGVDGGASRVQYLPPANEQPREDTPDIAPAPLALRLAEHRNTPRSPAGNLSTIEVTVTPPGVGYYSHAQIYYREQGHSGWLAAGPADDERTFVVPSDGKTYEVQARPVSIKGIEAPTGPEAAITTTNLVTPPAEENPVPVVLPVPNVRGLELFGQGNDTRYTGRDPVLVWREASESEWVQLGYEPPGQGAGAGALDQYFRDYELRIYDVATGALRRREHVIEPRYEYSFEKNREDSLRLGQPTAARTWRAELYTRGRQNQLSERAARITVTNPAPELPAGWTLTPGYFEAAAHFIAPDDPDFRHVRVYLSTEQGFTPSAETLVAMGADSPLTLGGLAQGKTYYYRYEAWDAFGPGSLSGELSFTTLELSAADIGGLSDWATRIEPLDRAWIEEKLEGDAIPSEKIESLTAAKITTGTLLATEVIRSEGLVQVVAGENDEYQVTLGPQERDGTLYALNAWDGASLRFGVRADGTLEAQGAEIEGVVHSGKQSYDDAAAGWWLGQEMGIYKAAITNANDTKGIRFDGDDLTILRDTELHGADAYNNKTTYFHEFVQSLDAWTYNTNSAGVVMLQNAHVTVRAGTAGEAHAKRTLGSSFTVNSLRWDAPARLKIPLRVAAQKGGEVIVSMGGDAFGGRASLEFTPSPNGDVHQPLMYVRGVLYHLSADGPQRGETPPYETVAWDEQVMEIIYDPGEGASFWWGSQFLGSVATPLIPPDFNYICVCSAFAKGVSDQASTAVAEFSEIRFLHEADRWQQRP